jgi:hypothetical protein
MASDGNVIHVRIGMVRGLNVELVAETTTTLFKPSHTVEDNKAQAAELVQWLRHTADEWEKDFAREFSDESQS